MELAFRRECAYCRDELHETQEFPTPCQEHVFCRECLTTIFEQALESESAYPPNCCGVNHPIPIRTVAPGLFDENFIDKYVAKEEEYKTHLKVRVYCANSDCGSFLAPYLHSNGRRQVSTVTCPVCATVTCVNCKKVWIPSARGHICAIDGTEKIEYTKENRVKRCPACTTLIWLAEACNHITCHCQAHFCFVCLETWEPVGESHTCPYSNDPEYDKELRDWRGLHRDTGLDRDGYGRRGYNQQGGWRRPIHAELPNPAPVPRTEVDPALEARLQALREQAQALRERAQVRRAEIPPALEARFQAIREQAEVRAFRALGRPVPDRGRFRNDYF